ncbi:MAG: hypothetical protein HZC22_01680, partial [Rhodocyclales bacterium]|nr:hypothetical protein [Rhodocyclales bacterium]
MCSDIAERQSTTQAAVIAALAATLIASWGWFYFAQQRTDEQVAMLNERFGHLCKRGVISRSAPLDPERKDADRLNKLDMRFLRDINRAWLNHFEDLFAAATAEAQREILPRGTYARPTMAEKYLGIIRAEAFKVVKDWNDVLTRKAKNILLQGMKDQVPAADLYAMTRRAMSDESSVWTRTAVRTKTTEVYNEARKLYFEEDPIAS